MISLAAATLARRAVLLGAGSATIAAVLARPAAALAQDSGTPAATPGAMVTAMPVVVQRWLEAMNASDAAAIAALFAPQGAYENAPLGASFRGADIEPLFAGFFSVVGDFHVEPRTAFSADDWAAVEWLWTSTDQGLFQAAGMPATGKPFAVQGCGSSHWRATRSAGSPITTMWRASWGSSAWCQVRGVGRPRLPEAPGP